MSGRRRPARLRARTAATRRRRPRPCRPRRRPRAGHRYAWLLGIAAILAVGALSIHSTRPDAPARHRRAGRRAAAAVRRRARDVGHRLRRRRRSLRRERRGLRRPSQGEAGSRPACEVRGPTVLNVCELTERGPLVLGLAASRGASCLDAFDRLAALARRHRGLQVARRRDRRRASTSCAASVRERGWSFPVGWDRDGILASVYGVAACPYVTVARWRGRVQGTLVGAVRPPAASSSGSPAPPSPRRGGRAGGRSARRRGAAPRAPRRPPRPASDHRRQQGALALGHRSDRLGLGHADAREELAGA